MCTLIFCRRLAENDITVSHQPSDYTGDIIMSHLVSSSTELAYLNKPYCNPQEKLLKYNQY